MKFSILRRLILPSSRKKADSSSPTHHHHHRHHRHHNHRHSHHASREKKQPEEPQEQPQLSEPQQEDKGLSLFDLDEPLTGRSPVRVGVPTFTTLSQLAKHLRWKFSEDSREIRRSDRIRFFGLPIQLNGNEIPEFASKIWYRVSKPEDNEADLEIEWHDTRQPGHLDQIQLDELDGMIKAGATVRDIRCKVASELSSSSSLNEHRTKAIEPDQVVIEALDGLRPGAIHGDEWTCKGIDNWLCRRIRISVVKPKQYFVFSGLNQRYVFHGQLTDSKKEIRARHLKQWLIHEILTTIQSQIYRLGGVKVEDVRLLSDGAALKDTVSVLPGLVVNFELSRKARTIYMEAEAWLLSPTITCVICTEEKRVSEMPIGPRITKNCTHEPMACRDCLGEWIRSRIEVGTWNNITCPECPQKLSFADIELHAPRDVFKRYDKLLTKAKLEKLPGFRWCLNPKCGAGQIHSRRCSKVKCHACKHAACAWHNVPWHDGETCNAYDKRTNNQKRNEHLSEKHMKKKTKPCPKCQKNVEKYSGCDHITCLCGHEWCWQCSATYVRDRQSFLRCRHEQTCRYFYTPPFWEGNAAVLAFMEPGALPQDDEDMDELFAMAMPPPAQPQNMQNDQANFMMGNPPIMPRRRGIPFID
ncbi:hypothetical protein F4861DRAFT_507296 [Xylaria intraflava]|nr:hypothetical protein F4861DRAFT_507296 [Xylaria intraflava]